MVSIHNDTRMAFAFSFWGVASIAPFRLQPSLALDFIECLGPLAFDFGFGLLFTKGVFIGVFFWIGLD